MEPSKVTSCCPPEPADLTMDALQMSRYSADQAITALRRGTSRSLRSFVNSGTATSEPPPRPRSPALSLRSAADCRSGMSLTGSASPGRRQRSRGDASAFASACERCQAGPSGACPVSGSISVIASAPASASRSASACRRSRASPTAVRVVRRQATGGGLAAGISSMSTRSVGARMNTSHIMSGCCWLPLMKPITRRPVACSITASKRSRISS